MNHPLLPSLNVGCLCTVLGNLSQKVGNLVPEGRVRPRHLLCHPHLPGYPLPTLLRVRNGAFRILRGNA